MSRPTFAALLSLTALLALATPLVTHADTQTRIVGSAISDASVGSKAWGSPGDVTADDALGDLRLVDLTLGAVT